MSWLNIALQGAKAFATANPELTQALVSGALDIGIQMHKQYEEEQAAKTHPQTEQETPEHQQSDIAKRLRGILDDEAQKVAKSKQRDTEKVISAIVDRQQRDSSSSQDILGA